MKQIVIAFILVFFAFGAIAQEDGEKKLTRKEKQAQLKIERAKEDSVVRAITDVIIANKQFVLEADQLRDRYGNMAFVVSNINFIAVDSNSAVFQFGSAQTAGINGIGGVTVEGRITSFKATKNKKNGSHYIQFNISSSLGMFDISMNVSGSADATATVNAMTRGKLNYSGNLVPLQTSTVYKGTSW